MIDERQEELAALAAFDLLEGGEKAQFDGEMARDPELRRRVEELREAATRLADLAPGGSPPESLKERVLASAAARKQVAPPHPIERSKVIPFPLIAAWAMAAGFALVAAGMTQLYFAARARTQVLAQQSELAQVELGTLHAQLETERTINERKLAIAEQQSDLAKMKVAMLASMLGNSPQAVAVAVWNPSRQEGVLSVDKLPAAATGKDYELWVIPTGAKAAPVPAGLVAVNASGHGHLVFKAASQVDSVAKFAVTLERKGGVPAPQGSMVLISE